MSTKRARSWSLDRSKPVLPMLPWHARAVDTRLQASRHKLAVRSPRCRHGPRHRQVLQTPPGQGVPRLPEGDRPVQSLKGFNVHIGMDNYAFSQDRGGQGLAGAASALARPLHADLRFLDQSGRTLVRRTDAQAVAARRAHLDPPARSRHPTPSSKSTTKTPSPSGGRNPPTTSLAAVKRLCLRVDQ